MKHHSSTINLCRIAQLQELKDLHQSKPTDDDRWRVFSYSKCKLLHLLISTNWSNHPAGIRALRNHPKRIESFAEARAIRGVGEKTAAKVDPDSCSEFADVNDRLFQIMEIIETGGLRRIRYETTDDVKATRLFQGIYGVGTSK